MKENFEEIRIKNNSGEYNPIKNILYFESNIGTIALDLKSGLNVVFTLTDCLGLPYKETTLVDIENKIAEFEEGGY